jgi:hypothetical protein
MKKILVTVIFLIIYSNTYSQGGFSWSRVVFGGNFGASFSSSESIVAVSPSVGYRFTERLTIGTGVIYQYNRIKLPPYDFQFNNYGARFYGTYQLTSFLVAHTEYELLDLEYITLNNFGIPDGTMRRQIGSFLVGGGYRQSFGSNSSVDILLLYNLTETPYTPYSNPILRIGFGIGL